MSGYTYRESGCTTERTPQEESATREFVTDAAGTDDLPDFGEPFGEPCRDSCVCRRITSYREKGVWVYVAHYSTPQPSARRAPEENLRSLEVGADVMTLEHSTAQTAITWVTSGEAVTQDLAFPIATDMYRVQALYSSLAGAVASVEDIRGHVNSASTLDIGGHTITAGMWYCHGGTIQEMRDEQGNERFQVTRIYEYKSLDDTGTKGWLYLWDKDAGIFDTLSSGLYPAATFSDRMPHG